MTTNGSRPAISFNVWKTGAESLQRLLTGMMHKLSPAPTAFYDPQAGTRLRVVRLVIASLRHFVTKTYP